MVLMLPRAVPTGSLFALPGFLRNHPIEYIGKLGPKGHQVISVSVSPGFPRIHPIE
jgi:hypothetical protein